LFSPEDARILSPRLGEKLDVGELETIINAISTWVVAALNLIPATEQMPSPAAADSTTSSTPLRPTVAWDSTKLHRVRDRQV